MSRRTEVMKSFFRYEEETQHRVQHGIELYRKGFAYLTIKDRNGNPISGVKVHAKLKKHEFLHGANIFMLDEMETEAKNDAYKQAFKNAFNEATVPFYWRDLEPEDGKPRFSKDSPKIYRRPAPDLCLEFCEQNDITPKAHCLTYINFDPKWLDEYDIPAVRRRIDRRYRELAERYDTRIPGWEVINEILCTNEKRELTPYYESDRLLEESFALAEKYFPYNELIVNEASQIWEPKGQFAYNRSAYYQMIERALNRGTRIDTIGLQFHAFRKEEAEATYAASLYNPKTIYKVLDQYAKLGKPLQITEITIPSFHEDPENLDIQADILERLYRIWFSHPAVEAAIYWNLVDGYAAFSPMGDMTAGENYYRGGLMNFDLTPKPAYERLINLFQNEWTTDVSCESNGEGLAQFMGFFGKYDIEIGNKKRTVDLSSKHVNNYEIII